MRMLGIATEVGQRRRYLQEQEIHMEAIAKAMAAPVPPKPMAPLGGSRIAQAKARVPKPMTALPEKPPSPLKPMGMLQPTGGKPMAPQKPMQPMKPVTKNDRLRRRGKFQRMSQSTVVVSKERPRKPLGHPDRYYAPDTEAARESLQGDPRRPNRHGGRFKGMKSVNKLPYAVSLAHSEDASVARRARALLLPLGVRASVGKRLVVRRVLSTPNPVNRISRGSFATRISKREPLKTSVSEDDARKLVDRHGLKGALPKELNREQRMAAYEARYVSAGGKKAEKWQNRAEDADKVKTIGLGVATVGGAGWLAGRTKGASKLVAKKPRLVHHAETLAGAGAVAGGAGELYAGHARRKRSSYASAPAGVAASALRRMQDYTPGG